MKVLYIFPRRSILAFISSAFSLICNISTSGLIIYENIKNILISAEFILKVEYYPKQDLNSYEFRVNVRLNCIEMSTKVTAVFNYCQPIVLPIILAYRRIRLDYNQSTKKASVAVLFYYRFYPILIKTELQNVESVRNVGEFPQISH